MKITLVPIFILVIAVSVKAVTIDFVPVGNPGNAPDTRFGGIAVGAVNYMYEIGKYEITAGQYTEFLNAVAAADPNGVYNVNMGDPIGAGIVRSGTSPNFSYSVPPEQENRPINFVSLWDAARFANWLHNGQPTGPQGTATTEDGAYHNVGSFTFFGRNTNAKYFVPTENEWYKAAFHKNDGTTGNYWLYAAGSDSFPINTLPDPGNHMNYRDTAGIGNNGYTIGDPYYRTEVGSFANSPSPYGTFDQGGNVEEWTETTNVIPNYVVRGGAWLLPLNALRASARPVDDARDLSARLGFRVATISVPEPSAIILAAFALSVVANHRRRWG